MKDQVDPRLFQQLDEAGEEEEVEAVVMVTKDNESASLAYDDQLDERGIGGRVIDRVVEHVQQTPSQVRFMPNLGVITVKGSGRFIRRLLEEEAVISATSNESTFTVE